MERNPRVGAGWSRFRRPRPPTPDIFLLGIDSSRTPICESKKGGELIVPCARPRTRSTMKHDGHRGPNGRKAEKTMGRLRESRRATSRAGRTLCITSNRRIVCPTRWHRESFRRKSAARTTAAASARCAASRGRTIDPRRAKRWKPTSTSSLPTCADPRASTSTAATPSACRATSLYRCSSAFTRSCPK